MSPRTIIPITARHACAFCPGWYELAEVAVIHQEPPCEVFKLLEPDHYAVASRCAWQHLRQVPPPAVPTRGAG